MSDKKIAPNVKEGLITVAFAKDELSTLASLMAIAMQTFGELAKQAASENKDTAFAVLSAREKLSAMYASKLSDALTIGEPDSKDYH